MQSFEKVLESIPERVRMRLIPVTFEPGDTIIEKGAPVTCGYSPKAYWMCRVLTPAALPILM